tara:strand:+ start:3640 stop:4185 length:546 start_codon:yes stop_codon:yes gene_type:complete
MTKTKRVFFAVNLPEKVKEEIRNTMLGAIPSDKWRTVKPENLHVTIRFIGYWSEDEIEKLNEKVSGLRECKGFEAEIKGMGHFRNRILWIGIEKGTEEFNLLNKKLYEALGVSEERFHAHITLAKNKDSKARETYELIEILREKYFKRQIIVKSLDLMESVLYRTGPEYTKLFSTEFKEAR